ncbi:hypothetical protein ABZ801_28905 [Actinomadura sp. NPDC047616]|uniref:hypothetical protein n=1 Tax=Actinomadura sp. NPDC047616 TaxID=3155914 RepID=UPI0033F08812
MPAPVRAPMASARDRTSSTRSPVAGSSGALLGTSWITALPVRALYCGGETDATPGRARSSPLTSAAACRPVSPPRVSARISSGPLNPGPNARVTWS